MEDLQFQLEEQGVISGDKLEVVEEGTQLKLAELEGQLAREREDSARLRLQQQSQVGGVGGGGGGGEVEILLLFLPKNVVNQTLTHESVKKDPCQQKVLPVSAILVWVTYWVYIGNKSVLL